MIRWNEGRRLRIATISYRTPHIANIRKNKNEANMFTLKLLGLYVNFLNQ